ncbi:ABC transporter substrate-binding protein [Salipiger aestuarii]|uniref:ABC transporter substrate-binding protein n=1 Tax=Salipiger aestuarii TaxID=568098 RepID=UPI002958A731|nr:ABC transporter substrate-binding protein [Salipiger aestuarii]
MMCHRGLLSHDRHGVMQGELAERWNVADDGTWTFVLRQALGRDGPPSPRKTSPGPCERRKRATRRPVFRASLPASHRPPPRRQDRRHEDRRTAGGAAAGTSGHRGCVGILQPPSGQRVAHDPEMARALLAEAGYPDGFDGAMLSTAQYGMLPSRAEVCQAYLSMIGVSVTLNLPEWTTRTLEVTIAASLIATGVPLGPMGRSGRMAGRTRWFR